jgi:dTDP-4-dehydrorhamnose reductase
MKVLITGGNGMLGRTLQYRLSDLDVRVADLPECDITDLGQVLAVTSEFRPQAVIHCAAMTAVDRCEADADEAFRVNAVGSANVGIACHRVGARLLAVSTDYVFSGELDRPYHEWDPAGPRTVYGASKLAGEQAVRAHCPDHCIVRVGWLYGPGGPSFVHAMLKLGAVAGEPVPVVSDQVGNPTSTDAVADRLRDLLERPVAGVFHLTCEDDASWFDFALAIFKHRPASREIIPCTSSEYPRPAPRPRNSRLEKRALRLHGLSPMPGWRAALARFFQEHPDG